MSKQKKIVQLVVFILFAIGLVLCILWCTSIGLALSQLYENEYAAQIAAFGVYNEHLVVLNQAVQMGSCVAQLVCGLVLGVICFTYIVVYVMTLVY